MEARVRLFKKDGSGEEHDLKDVVSITPIRKFNEDGTPYYKYVEVAVKNGDTYIMRESSYDKIVNQVANAHLEAKGQAPPMSDHEKAIRIYGAVLVEVNGYTKKEVEQDNFALVREDVGEGAPDLFEQILNILKKPEPQGKIVIKTIEVNSKQGKSATFAELMSGTISYKAIVDLGLSPYKEANIKLHGIAECALSEREARNKLKRRLEALGYEIITKEEAMRP